MKHYLTSILLVLGAVCTELKSQAQITEKYKPERFAQQFEWGEVTLTSGEKLQGPITLHWAEDMVILTQPGQRVVPVVQISYFRVQQEQSAEAFDRKKFYDFGPMRRGYYPGRPRFEAVVAEAHRLAELPPTATRVFHACYWSQTPTDRNFRALGFFEQLSAGPVMLLRRQALVLKTATYGIAGGGVSQRWVDKKDGLYLSLADGSLVLLDKPQDFYDCFPAVIPQVQAFARQHNLGLTKPNEVAYLVNYANSLVANSQP
ncbi:hypothetical protein KLP40_04815 [Hymenobacter sp. NST-14]|uniref:hypothetical protein n=1 Tax=Hymenobacter piscis TaxID=2839984 RepID=UPI001C01188F|nr:hypothetical protein [Hymenobacter piscis]MBT9392477.1 hypothetical protein [Hymenobacter piscis]